MGRWAERRTRVVAVLAGGAVVALAGCTVGSPEPSSAAPSSAATSTGSSATATPADSPTATTTPRPAPSGPDTVAVVGVTDVVTGLDVPWGIAFLPGGDALVTLRDEARAVLVGQDGALAPVTGPGADQLAEWTRPQGEGGLLGVAVLDDAGTVAFYLTAADDNRVVRGTLAGTTLGELTPIVTGIAKAGNHDGGRLAVGPDGYLYVTTGDAGDRPRSQDGADPAGKILRVTADGQPAPGNPSPGSPVWSLGHRNVQGLGWASDGRMFASEFGQNTWDELNLVQPGANYGWPDVEGRSAAGVAAGFTDPLAVWATDDASPSGLAVTDEGVYLAGLRGERLWRVPLRPDGVGEPQPLLVGEHGRLRAVAVAPDGALWVLTNNTDGRGTPRAGDDRILRVTVG